MIFNMFWPICSGQARQRSGGNYYIDVVDIKAAAATKNLHTLLKYDVTLQEYNDVPCSSNICIDEIDDQFEITIEDTEYLLYLIAQSKLKLFILLDIWNKSSELTLQVLKIKIKLI